MYPETSTPNKHLNYIDGKNDVRHCALRGSEDARRKVLQTSRRGKSGFRLRNSLVGGSVPMSEINPASLKLIAHGGKGRAVKFSGGLSC